MTDHHTNFASKLFGIPPDKINKTQRNYAKKRNYMLGYSAIDLIMVDNDPCDDWSKGPFPWVNL